MHALSLMSSFKSNLCFSLKCYDSLRQNDHGKTSELLMHLLKAFIRGASISCLWFIYEWNGKLGVFPNFDLNDRQHRSIWSIFPDNFFTNLVKKMGREMCYFGSFVWFTILTSNQAAWNIVLKSTSRGRENAIFPSLSNSRLPSSFVLDIHRW